MGLPKTLKRYTPQEYYALERDAVEKNDYYQGEIFPSGRYADEVRSMAGGTERHSRICTNIIREIGTRLLGTQCTDYDSNLRLRVLATDLRAYPDLSVYCGKMERDPEDPEATTFINPNALFEVLSKSTETFDRGLKWISYQQIASLHTYVMVSQAEPKIEVFDRPPDGSWTNRIIEGLAATLQLRSLRIEVPIEAIYNQIDFSAAEDD
jgi:Uma2 family endonuclease